MQLVNCSIKQSPFFLFFLFLLPDWQYFIIKSKVVRSARSSKFQTRKKKIVRYLHNVTGITFTARNSSQRLIVGNGYVFVTMEWKMSFALSGKFVAIDETRLRELYEKLSKKKKYVCLCQGLPLCMEWMDRVTTISFSHFWNVHFPLGLASLCMQQCVGTTNWAESEDARMTVIASLRSSGRHSILFWHVSMISGTPAATTQPR